MGLIRMHKPGTVHFVTNRCEHQQFLMLPTAEINQIIRGWFVKAHALYGEGIEVFAFIFMSNHFHCLLRNNGGNLARFMGYMQSNIAREINRLLEREGKFFAREYDDVIVEGDKAFLNRYCYVVSNAVKSGLVDNAKKWPGFSSIHNALSDKPFRVSVLNRTKLHNATRNEQNADNMDYLETFEMRLSVPPMWSDKSLGERRELIRQHVSAAEHEYKTKRGHRPALGLSKLLSQKHTDRPKHPARSPRFKILCFDEELKKELLQSYRAFVGIYREMLEGFRIAAALRKRPTIEWPTWSYPPSCPFPIGAPGT